MYDCVVVGGGPAGVTAALRARELGASVALVERDRLGGTCTNDGCVPTRVLAKSARLIRDCQQLSHYGLLMDSPVQVDFAAVMQRTQSIVQVIHAKKQLGTHLNNFGVKLYNQAGDTKFINPHTLSSVSHGLIEGEHFILAVGGHARQLPFAGAEHVLMSSSIWDLRQAPKSVLIIGGGASGCQFASVFEDFGAKVTLLDIAPRILMVEDETVSMEIARQFAARGIDLVTGIQSVEKIEKEKSGLNLSYRDGAGSTQQLKGDIVLATVGWPGNVDHLGLDKAGVQTERSYIVVNDYLQTTAAHIYACGDITGRSNLVQSAGYQARIAVENALLSFDQASRERLVPHGGFTDPEYGGVGLTEAQARAHYDVVTAAVPYTELDRAVIDDRWVGFCKLVVDRRSGQVLGAHVVGEQAVEIVSTVSAAMAGKLHVQQLADLELAYPTFVAVIGLAARQIARKMGTISVHAEWRELQVEGTTEWERSSQGG